MAFFPYSKPDGSLLHKLLVNIMVVHAPNNPPTMSNYLGRFRGTKATKRRATTTKRTTRRRKGGSEKAKEPKETDEALLGAVTRGEGRVAREGLFLILFVIGGLLVHGKLIGRGEKTWGRHEIWSKMISVQFGSISDTDSRQRNRC